MTAEPLPASTLLLRTTDLRKSYGGVKALQGASIDVHAGEVLALLGENGTGKSTMMRILAGVEYQDDGELSLDGQPVEFRSAAQARAAGVGIVFQELSLFPDLDVLANLFVGREITKRRRVDRAAMRREAMPIVTKLGLTFPLSTKVADLTLAERQLVEIGKALLGHARLLILDEPNSALNGTESARLFKLIGEMKAEGTAIIYISHRLEEVFALADRIAVMRAGRIVEVDRTDNLTISSVVEAMLGRKSVDATGGAPARVSSAPVVLRLDKVRVRRRLDDVSLTVHQGEVLGLAGLEGAGQQDVLRAVFGDLVVGAGGMELDGRTWRPTSPRDAAKAGVAFVPADRTKSGLMMQRSIGDNIAQVRMALSSDTVYSSQDLHARAERRVAELRIRTSDTHLPANSLSGGNQQKVVLAKWLEISPRVLLLDDPTRGVDVGGKSEIYELITRMAATGVTVLFTSTEFAEYQAVCHRVVVFRAGQAVEELDASLATEHALAAAVNTGKPSRLGSTSITA
ncbi:sugar ABC transporter ATP-binding protein [Acidothermaceae bacterium B102]|nr:sugar ABC transporter ATP-binding protein [Acidothermaceae bacterium B102]